MGFVRRAQYETPWQFETKKAKAHAFLIKAKLPQYVIQFRNRPEIRAKWAPTSI